MKLWNHYHTPTTAEDAVALLAQYAGAARIIAGGTDLLIDLRASGGHTQEALVDITRIPELCTITQEGDHVLIGAGVTHTQIVKSPLLQSRAAALVESCGVVGGPQVRNVATLGGNVAHALPAGDGTTSLVALEAEVEIIKDGVRQWVPILAMYRGPGESLLDPTRELLVRFRFALCGAGEATAFSRVMRPQGVALPVLGCAVWVKLAVDRQTIAAARVCIAPIGPVPGRVAAAEVALVGQVAAAAAVERAIDAAQNSLTLRTSKYRATGDYRHAMTGTLLRRTLTTAIARAQEGV